MPHPTADTVSPHRRKQCPALPKTNAYRLPGDYSASGCGRIWNRTISLVIPLPPSLCQFVTES